MQKYLKEKNRETPKFDLNIYEHNFIFQNSILCEPCGWPLVAKSRKPFIDHFRSIHPNIAVPYGLEPRNIRNAYEKEVFAKF